MDRTKSKNSIAENLFALENETHNSAFLAHLSYAQGELL